MYDQYSEKREAEQSERRRRRGPAPPYFNFFLSFLPVGRGASALGARRRARARKMNMHATPAATMRKQRIWPVVKLNGLNW
jgi:hypothetical protein